jgi:hypothetical protein
MQERLSACGDLCHRTQNFDGKIKYTGRFYQVLSIGRTTRMVPASLWLLTKMRENPHANPQIYKNTPLRFCAQRRIIVRPAWAQSNG